MFDKTKYIIIEKSCNDLPIIFPEFINHRDMVNPNDKVISAGFVKFYVNESGNVDISCYGESVSLDVKSRGDIDTKLMERYILNRS
jgi:hypothetical protein